MVPPPMATTTASTTAPSQSMSVSAAAMTPDVANATVPTTAMTRKAPDEVSRAANIAPEPTAEHPPRHTGDVDAVSPALHLAQFNIAVLRHPIGHPATAGFEALIDETNRHAEASEGFVWRHGIDARDLDTTAYDDPLITVNASVWISPTHLRDFAYRGFHRDVFRQRDDWFVDSAAVLWWLPAGTVPSLEECKRRLAFHDQLGTTPHVFGMGERVPAFVLHRSSTADGGTIRAELDRTTVATTTWTVADHVTTADVSLTIGDAWLQAALVDALGTDALARGGRRLVITDLGVDQSVERISHRPYAQRQSDSGVQPDQ